MRSARRDVSDTLSRHEEPSDALCATGSMLVSRLSAASARLDKRDVRGHGPDVRFWGKPEMPGLLK